jgi:hypothetical protein
MMIGTVVMLNGYRKEEMSDKEMVEKRVSTGHENLKFGAMLQSPQCRMAKKDEIVNKQLRNARASLAPVPHAKTP